MLRAADASGGAARGALKVCGTLAQTLRGLRQAEDAGHKIRRLMEADGKPFRLYFYMSPYRRSSQVRAL